MPLVRRSRSRKNPAMSQDRGAKLAKQPPAPALRDRIASAALDILEREGPQAVSMRRVAERVGVTPMAIYHHYANREALLQALVYREMDRLRTLAANIPPGARPADLAHAADAFLDYAFAHPHMFDYIYTAPRPRPVRYPDDFKAGKSGLTPLAEDVAASMAAGEFEQDDSWEVALQIWAHGHGLVSLYRAGWFTLDEADFRALYHRSLARLVRGLRAAPKP